MSSAIILPYISVIGSNKYCSSDDPNSGANIFSPFLVLKIFLIEFFIAKMSLSTKISVDSTEFYPEPIFFDICKSKCKSVYTVCTSMT